MAASTIAAVSSKEPPSRTQKLITDLKGGDPIAYCVTVIFAASVLLITVLLVYELWIRCALPREKFGIGFLFSQAWDPIAGKFGALPFIYGTIVTSVVALLISVPLGVGAAIFLAELAPPRWSSIFTFLVELLAAVPSVIYGLLAIFTLIPLLRNYIEPALQKSVGFLPIFSGPIVGVSYLAAGIILAIMTFPYIISVSRESLLDVPADQREAALALGATHWEATYQVVIPYARLGIMGSIFLGLARALGETMAVTMVIGNDPKVYTSLLHPGYTIAAVIANEFAEATSDLHQQALIELGLVLFLITIIMNGAARLLIELTNRKG